MTIPSQRPPAWVALVCAFVLAVSAPARGQVNSNIHVPQIKYTDFTLPNGLRVILHEDHSSPIVALDVWYNAGSKLDPKGKTGLAHMFEHMMDEGSVNMPNGEYKRIIQEAGGYFNAGTNNDWVHYFSVVPSNQLETDLWLEAERMANLSPSLERFTLEREAVKNEYRRWVAQPPGAASVAMIQAVFAGGAYAPPGFGFPEDLASITLDDMHRFYDAYYVPNNAVLVIVGDFATADARRMVQRQFSPIPRGKPVTAPSAVPPLRGEQRIVIEHQAGNRGVWAAWQGAKSTAPDRPAVMALSSILTDRLRRILVTERRVAITLNPQWNQAFDMQQSGIFQVAMTPNATASASMFEDVMDSVITSIKVNGVTDQEVRRWVAAFRMQMLTQMQSDTSIAANLGDATLNQNNPLGNYEIVDRAQRLTPAQVQAAAKKYLTADRVVLSIIPTGKFDLISKPNLPYVIATPKNP